ncbi:MAG: response regulator [Chloroflexi bacterium]|nr:response regulator [Chloroflexota bacterium]
MSKYILVIEPSRILRNILGVHLQLAGHAVMTFSTYGLTREALSVFQRQPPDLIFVALHLSQPESCTLLGRVRMDYPNATLAALVMPEEHEHRTLQTALQETQAIVLLKPFKIQEVLALCASGQLSQQQRMRHVQY